MRGGKGSKLFAYIRSCPVSDYFGADFLIHPARAVAQLPRATRHLADRLAHTLFRGPDQRRREKGDKSNFNVLDQGYSSAFAAKPARNGFCST
jgi:hypothetical protein